MNINICKNFFYLQKKLKKIFIENKAIRREQMTIYSQKLEPTFQHTTGGTRYNIRRDQMVNEFVYQLISASFNRQSSDRLVKLVLDGYRNEDDVRRGCYGGQLATTRTLARLLPCVKPICFFRDQCKTRILLILPRSNQ